MNNNTGNDANAGRSPSQPALSNCDKHIMKAMGLFANVLRSARREAEEANVSVTRKAELEVWIERHAADIDAHIEKLGAFIGLDVDPEKDVELGDLLKTTVVPP
ncbi:hypothetical protein MBLNU13_g10494t1 [Cladosporium sp. NU13]